MTSAPISTRSKQPNRSPGMDWERSLTAATVFAYAALLGGSVVALIGLAGTYALLLGTATAWVGLITLLITIAADAGREFVNRRSSN